ncbi:alginate lyase family protein [Microbulbifer sp. 2201CG32-9]|uniref:alginate lyase family protein n=1 Tax=Microbulbifer sp. 2201CG32-9 TaxID=3232309 RepID=UPI00345C3775
MFNLRSIVGMIPGARAIKQAVWGRMLNYRPLVSFPKNRESPKSLEIHEFSSAENGNFLSEDRAHTFVLYRIIGNDLVPRHEKGQSRRNLEFILRHEEDLEGCEKRFVVNRIVDSDEERHIIALLEEAGLPYLHIPFSWAEYQKTGWDVQDIPIEFAPFSRNFEKLSPSSRGSILMRQYRHKNNYVMNNNGARNAALESGKVHAKWVLPWDGNCFLTVHAWDKIRQLVIAHGSIPYHIVPMARIVDNDELLDPTFRPNAIEEPQVIFRADSSEVFDSEYPYGRRSKVEFFWRIGYPGKWDNWPIELWDLPCPEYSPDTGRYAEGGWVARLYSGKAELEKGRDRKAWIGRGEARTEAIASMLDMLDAHAFDHRLELECPVFVPWKDDVEISTPAKAYLGNAVTEALKRGPFSVVDKTTLPPSGVPHDYWHPAPYYWPHPLKIPGLPYVRRDGQRVSGTRMYEPLSDKYDRTRLQYMFDDTYTMAIAWRQYGDPVYGSRGGELIRHWFLKPETAMTPHLKYAQVRRGHNRNRGSSTGIIEFKDLYYFLDAVRILKRGGFLTGEELVDFKAWLVEYLEWLRTSEQGIGERAALNNHGTYYDLQIAAICAFLGEAKLLRETLRDSRIRLLAQFDAQGAQPHELKRTNTAHYCCFNLQGWIHLAHIAESVGEDLWNFTGEDGRGLKKGMEWLLARSRSAWPYRQIEDFDSERFLPIAYCYQEKYGHIATEIVPSLPAAARVKSKFHPHDGIRPYWNLFMPDSSCDAICGSQGEGITA